MNKKSNKLYLKLLQNDNHWLSLSKITPEMISKGIARLKSSMEQRQLEQASEKK